MRPLRMSTTTGARIVVNTAPNAVARIYQTSLGRSSRRILWGWDADVGPSLSSVSASARGLEMSSTLGASVFAGLSEGFPMTSFGETLPLVCANTLGGDSLEGGA